MNAIRTLCCAVLVCAPTALVHATDTLLWSPVDEQRLDEQRGGFYVETVLRLSFGIERVVYVNDVAVVRTSVRIPDVAAIEPEQAQALADFNRGVVVQVGERNRFDPARSGGGIAIQNTLDNQNIRTLTHVEVATDALGVLQGINSYGALTDALVRVPGTP